MKLNKLLLAGAFFALTFLQSVSAYEPPTDSQISNMLANPSLITKLLGDATGKEAATLMKRIIDRINATDMAKKEKDYLISFYTGRVASLLSEVEAQNFAKELVSIAPTDSLGVIFAGLSVGRGGSTSFTNLLKELAGENKALQTAIGTPDIALTTPVYNLLVANLANTQSRAPTATDSLPPPGNGTAPTPVPVAPIIPAPYNGQG